MVLSLYLNDSADQPSFSFVRDNSPRLFSSFQGKQSEFARRESLVWFGGVCENRCHTGRVGGDRIEGMRKRTGDRERKRAIWWGDANLITTGQPFMSPLANMVSHTGSIGDLGEFRSFERIRPFYIGALMKFAFRSRLWRPICWLNRGF